MRFKSIARRTLCACLLTSLAVPVFGAFKGQFPQGRPQGQPQGQAAKVPDDERKALEAINTATEITGKLQAGTEFLKKFGKSPRRPRVASYLANEISKVPDNAQRVTLGETFAASFNQPEETDLVKPTIIDALVKLRKFDEAFAEGAKYLPRHPDDVILQTQLGIVGVEQAQHQNPKYAQVSQQYATKAIELMEVDKKPVLLDDAGWKDYRTQWLPRLYQAQGVVLYLTNDRPGARAKFEKSISLDGQNPSALMMLGMLTDDEYQVIAKQYNIEKSGPGKDAMLKQAVAKMDEVIEWFARAVASSDGKPDFQTMNEQLRQNLEAYYKFRNNGSTEGMSKIIEKYKKPVGQ